MVSCDAMRGGAFVRGLCSTCPTASTLLDEHGVDYELVRNLDTHPSTEGLRHLVATG